MIDEGFFVTTMPPSRPADYYLGYLGGCVFLDFNNVDANRICLKRISCDGYGCCELPDSVIPLNEDDSKVFKDIFREEGIKNQETLMSIVKRTIALNKEFIWSDALDEYQLI